MEHRIAFVRVQTTAYGRNAVILGGTIPNYQLALPQLRWSGKF